MNADEKALLERSLKLTEENNLILHKIERAARWAFVWGVVKIFIIILPLVIGILLLEPYIGPLREGFEAIRKLVYMSR